MSNYIKKFQTNNGLVSDGVIGKKTLQKIKEKYKLNDFEISHFMGQAHHESGGFTVGYENLNYSESGLLAIFPK